MTRDEIGDGRDALPGAAEGMRAALLSGAGAEAAIATTATATWT